MSAQEAIALLEKADPQCDLIASYPTVGSQARAVSTKVEIQLQEGQPVIRVLKDENS